jgi:hypothetical protein
VSPRFSYHHRVLVNGDSYPEIKVSVYLMS